MLHLLIILFIYGVDTESVKCPEACSCIETSISDFTSSTTSVSYNHSNISHISSTQSTTPSKTVLINFKETNSKIINDGINHPRNFLQPKKCAKNTVENVRNIFIYNFSRKSLNNLKNNESKEVRNKRTLNLNVNHTVNTKKLREGINETLEEQATANQDKLKEDTNEKYVKSSREKEIFTYDIKCSGIRDLKPTWLQYLPNPTTQLNIRQAFFQSFRTFQQILKEIPIKLNRLTVLSISSSIINQRIDKKIPSKADSTNKERKPTEKREEKKHSEFLPFASLQNPTLRSKSDLEFSSKGKCKNLQVLNLVNNTITYLPQDTFLPFLNLQILNLSNNLIEFIDNETFNSLINLLQLDIHNNRLQFLNEIMFKNLTKLLFLDLSQNLISNIAPSTFQYLMSLNVLNLASNPLLKKQEAMILLGTGKRLQIVDISKTGLKQIPGTLERSVRILNLMGNHLLSIRCGDLDSYSLLSYLNLKANKISYVEDDALGRLEFLSNLQISENNLFQIPKSLPNNLEILNLSYNNIQNITNLDFLNLSLLKELSLSYNQVSNIEGKAFNNLVHLKVLDLSHNPILILPTIYGRVKLRVLNLSCFTNIPGSFSARYQQFPVQSPESIKLLNLESSPVLTKIFLQDTKTLESFSNLEELDLRFTNLTTIRKDIFKLLPKLKILKVEGNPWHCGREILMLSKWLKIHENEEATKNEDEVNTAHCSTPSNLYKTTLTTLNERDFQDFENNKIDILANSAKVFQKDSAYKKKVENLKIEVENHLTEVKFANPSKRENITVEKVSMKNSNIKNYNRHSANANPFLSSKKMENFTGENCSEKIEEKLERNSKTFESLPNKSISEEKSLKSTSNSISASNLSFINWSDNISDFGIEEEKAVKLNLTQVSLRTLKKAEAVTAKDTLTLKKEYNSHLSFFILSSVGLVVMATLTFTSLYFSRTRRDQHYQRQNQDIEVCSISSLRNELW